VELLAAVADLGIVSVGFEVLDNEEDEFDERFGVQTYTSLSPVERCSASQRFFLRLELDVSQLQKREVASEKAVSCTRATIATDSVHWPPRLARSSTSSDPGT